MLKANDGEVMNAFRLHTESIINVMKQLGKDTLTVAVLMDLQDWCARYHPGVPTMLTRFVQVPEFDSPDEERKVTDQGLRAHLHHPNSSQLPQAERSSLLAFVCDQPLVRRTVSTRRIRSEATARAGHRRQDSYRSSEYVRFVLASDEALEAYSVAFVLFPLFVTIQLKLIMIYSRNR